MAFFASHYAAVQDLNIENWSNTGYHVYNEQAPDVGRAEKVLFFPSNLVYQSAVLDVNKNYWDLFIFYSVRFPFAMTLQEHPRFFLHSLASDVFV